MERFSANEKSRDKWIKMCTQTQNKLERFALGAKHWLEMGGCVFCEHAVGSCYGDCLIGRVEKVHCRAFCVPWYHELFRASINGTRISYALALHMWLDELKELLRNGEL